MPSSLAVSALRSRSLSVFESEICPTGSANCQSLASTEYSARLMGGPCLLREMLPESCRLPTWPLEILTWGGVVSISKRWLDPPRSAWRPSPGACEGWLGTYHLKQRTPRPAITTSQTSKTCRLDFLSQKPASFAISTIKNGIHHLVVVIVMTVHRIPIESVS